MDWATVITYIWYRDLILKIQEFIHHIHNYTEYNQQ